VFWSESSVEQLPSRNGWRARGGPPPQDPATNYSEECRPADRLPLLSLEVVERSDRVEQQRHQNVIRKPKRGVEQPRLI